MSTKPVIREEKFQVSLITDNKRGYDFVTTGTIEQLQKLSFPEANVFSLYLDVSPEKMEDAPWHIRYKDLVKNMQAQITDKDSRKMFEAVADNIQGQLRNELGRPEVRGLALFAVPEKVSAKGAQKIKYSTFTHCQLPESPQDTLLWEKTAEITPLILQLDEQKTTGVVMIDRQHGRFYLYTMGEVAEYSIAEKDHTPPRVQEGGGMRAYPKEQREMNAVQKHLQNILTLIEKIGQQEKWHWLAVGGVGTMPAELVKELPKNWKDKLIGTFDLAEEVALDKVRDAVAPLVKAADAQVEKKTVQKWISLLERQEKAVSSLADTLTAIQEGRVQTLLLAAGYTHGGWQCQQCNALTAEAKNAACPYCGGQMTHVTDIVNTAVSQTFNSDGQIEIVRDQDNLSLMQKHGSIGAILRF